MFQKFRDWIKPALKKGESGKLPEISSIPADQNPWGVPLLDVRPVTHQMLSSSKDPACAKNLISFGKEDGRAFASEQPDTARRTAVNLAYRIDRMLAPGPLFLPSEMEHKWALFYFDSRIIFVRSWQRKVVATAEVEIAAGMATLRAVIGSFAGDPEEGEFTRRCVDFLIRTHALGLPFPAPIPVDIEKARSSAAMWCMNTYGNRAAVATHLEVKAGIPEKPLRSHSLMHIAVARGDVEEAQRFLRDGIPIDLLAADGLTPLHWAFGQNDLKVAEFLIGEGAHVDARSDEGATPLLTVAQGGDVRKIEFLLDHGADINALDARGFGVLHRVAEPGNVELVRMFLKRGARDVAAQGHTARSFAEKRGHAEVVQLLKEHGF